MIILEQRYLQDRSSQRLEANDSMQVRNVKGILFFFFWMVCHEDIRRASHPPKGEVQHIGRLLTHCPKCVAERESQ